MRVAVLRAVEEVSGTNEHGNISAIARRAGVSRDFIYDHPELLAEAHRVSASKGALVADSDGSYQRGLSARNRLLSSEVERLRGEADEHRAEVEQLAKYRALYLGAQLPGPHKIDPEAYAELRANNERLLQDNSELRAKLRRVEETVRARDEDLSAVRATLAEVLNQDSAGGNVSLFRPRLPGPE